MSLDVSPVTAPEENQENAVTQTETAPPKSAVDRAAIEQKVGLSAKQKVRRHKSVVYALRIALLVAVLGFWEIACTYWFDPFFYSKPSLIWDKLTVWFTDGTANGSIWMNISVTLQEAVFGFVLGSLLGIIAGIALGRSRLAAEVMQPYIQGLNAVPRVVLAALFVIWFGLGMTSKVATALVLVFFPVFFNAFQGAREVDGNLINNARILGASRWDVMKSIVVPSATSWILASLHTAFGFALIGAIVGEYTGSTHGIGLLINTAQSSFDSAGVYAGMLISTLLALTAEIVLGRLEKRLLKWRPQTGSSALQV